MVDEQALEILNNFKKLPKLHQGKEIEVSFVNPDFGRALCSGAMLDALDLEFGATVRAGININSKIYIDAYAEGEIAQRLLELPKGETIRARVRTIFGIRKEPLFTEEGTLVEKSEIVGLLVLKILTE